MVDFTKLNDDRRSINKFLREDVHTELFAQLKNKQQEEDAKFLEKWLQEYRDITHKATADSSNKQPDWSQIQSTMGVELIAQAIDESLPPKSKVYAANLFKVTRQADKANAKAIGDKLENDIKILMDGFAQHFNINNGHGAMVVGSNSAIPSILKDVKGKTLNASKKAMEEYNNAFLKSKDSLNIVGTAGKVDVIGDMPKWTGSLKGKSASYKNLVRAQHILSQATISAKNYGSVRWSRDKGGARTKEILLDAGIHLGASNTIKAIFSVLGGLGATMDEADKGFARMYVCYMKAHNHSQETAKHIYDLRYIYELSGYGLDYKSSVKNIGTVQFFIWNDYSGQTIYVFSISELIENLFEGNGEMSQVSNPFANVTVNKRLLDSISGQHSKNRRALLNKKH